MNREPQVAELPARIHTIQIAFRNDERFIHSITFEGEGGSVLSIESDKQEDRGRVETLKLEPGESLIGCEMYCCEEVLRGVRWMTWHRPMIETAQDQPTESNRK